MGNLARRAWSCQLLGPRGGADPARFEIQRGLCTAPLSMMGSGYLRSLLGWLEDWMWKACWSEILVYVVFVYFHFGGLM